VAAIKDYSVLLEGNRTGVLLIHGLGGTPTEMKNLAMRVSEAGVTVACCQLTGHCGTENDLAATSWREWYASTEAALSELEERCDTIIVGGLSMGALLSALLAARHPTRVHGILMLAPTLWYDGWAMPWYAFMAKFMPKGFRAAEREPYGLKDERIRRMVLSSMTNGDSFEAGVFSTPAQSVRELARLVKVLKPELRSVLQPTLLVQAREDDIASLSNAHYLQRHLGGLVETLILNDSYHLVTIDRQRMLVSDRVRTFVKTLAAQRITKTTLPLHHAAA